MTSRSRATRNRAPGTPGGDPPNDGVFLGGSTGGGLTKGAKRAPARRADVSPQLAPAAQKAVSPSQLVFQAGKTHVTVTATGKDVGMKELAAAMQKDPKLHNCVIEQCRFDEGGFFALLRIVA